MRKNLTTKEFIKKSQIIHNKKYDYKKVNYIKSNIKINIICKIHGEFLQTPLCHLYQKQGCPKCAGNIISDTTEFISKAKPIHGSLYDYSRVNYINNHTKVEILCPIHGSFLITPKHHCNGIKCSKCSDKKALGKEEFILRSKLIHNNTYNYSNIIYVNNKTKLEIVCKIHGSFWQKPNNHLNKQGCPKCKYEKLSNITISKRQIEFLDYLNITSRNVAVNNFIVDGIKDNIIYEFLGDYWHGNSEKYNSTDFNKLANKTFGELYNYTFWRFNKLKERGYEIKYIWENDWKKFQKRTDDIPKILTF